MTTKITKTKIEALAVEHEAFGFGRVDAEGYTTHGFNPDGLHEFVTKIIKLARAEAIQDAKNIIEKNCTWGNSALSAINFLE